MSDGQNLHARDVFMDLAELPIDQHDAALDEACGEDSVLRRQVQALLKAHVEAQGFMANPTSGVDASVQDLDATQVNITQEHPGEQIGRYKLLQQIGEGGFGTVWLAEQREPVKRRVALKVIKLGMDTKQVIARFEAERQALAMMDHPNIARVFDAGATDTGRPYFVMEYIKGVPIVEYCDTAMLDTKARLDLFSTTCEAIQHAHQKGIIHRDIKPSNVLVTLHDGRPVPKVIDFGIAKATNAELTNKTLFTEHRQMIGTPAYMSPEQAEMSGLDIDTRADIYSLGVLLYELLTGTTPFDTRALLEAGHAEMMRVIREEEPHKPSTRLSSLGNVGTRNAELRLTSLKKLSLVLKGDLDWIVMKCLEKDRTRRYETANGLAADILRHLSDEPVVAGPPSTSYKLRKFMRRNRGKVVVGGVIAALLVLGVVGTSTALVRAVRAEQEARDQADRAEQETTKTQLALERTRVLGLTIASAEAANRDSMRALLLAREAARISKHPAVLTQLHSAIQGSLERTILRGHKALVRSAEFSPSGDRILTASRDKTVRIWDRTGQELVVLRGHTDDVIAAIYSPTGERILSVSEDQTVRLWDLEGKELSVLPGHGFSHWLTVFSPTGDRFVTVASKDSPEEGKTAHLWDLDGQELAVFRGHEGPLNAASISPTGDRILTVSRDKTARLWDLEGRELTVFQGPIGAAFFSSSGQQVLVTEENGARLLDLEGQELAVLGGGDLTISSAVFSHSGDRILTTGDQSTHLWDLEGKQLASFGNRAITAAFSPSGDRILTRSVDAAVRVWNLGGQELAVLRGHEEAALAAVFSPSGNQVLTAGEKSARLWDVESKELAVFRQELPFSSAVYSPTGDQLLVATPDGIARLLDLQGKELSVFRGHKAGLTRAAFSSSGDRVVTASWDRTARVWDLEGNELAVLEGHEGMVRFAAFSPSGDRIVTASQDNTARLWDLSGKELVVFHGHDAGQQKWRQQCVSSAVFSPSGDQILTASWDKTARLWDLEGQELAVIRGHEESVLTAVFSPSGDRILTCSKDRTARVWDLEGNELTVIQGHEGLVMTAVFSPSGDRILTASWDRTARLWDLEGNEIAALRVLSPLTNAAFSPSGDHIITAAFDGTAHVWLAHSEDLLELADERVSRDFTAEERRRYSDLFGHDPDTDR